MLVILSWWPAASLACRGAAGNGPLSSRLMSFYSGVPAKAGRHLEGAMPHAIETLTVAGAKIRLFRGGAGTPLVFLHGAGGHTGWMAFLEELATRFEVFAPEHPGFGQSDDPPWLDEIADLAYFHLDLLEALGLERVHLMGTSLGGWVAAEMAVRSTARLASLTLIGAVGITAGGEPMPDIFRMPEAENLRRYYADPERAT